MAPVIHAIHLSDTHIGPSPDFEFRGAVPRARLDRIVRAIQALDFQPDFIVHTGDVVNSPAPDAYAGAAEALAPLNCPLYCVTGNHDDAAMLAAGIPMGARVPLTDENDRLAYRFEFPGLIGYVLDAKVLDSELPHGCLPESQLAALADSLAKNSAPFAVFVHFPPFAVHSPWIDRHLPLSNGAALHALLRRQDPGRVRGVFVGHLHRSIQTFRDGILYSGAGSPACGFSASLQDEKITFSSDAPLPFQLLSFSADGVVIKEFFAP